MSKRGTAMLDEPEQRYAAASEQFDRSGAVRRSSSAPSRPSAKLRPDYGEDFADDYADADADAQRRRDKGRPRQSGLKFRIRARVPKSLAGRIATGVALLVIGGIGIALLMLTRSFLLHDGRFMIQSAASIEIQGNQHLTRSQLLDIFGEDIERNIFRISLADRQAELEQLPWVRHATVMRLLPGRIRVSISERTPVAFVRQGGHIGLVDGSGVLLDMAPSGTAAQTEPHYSFPVVTGLSGADPASTRAARMKIFQRFTADLDSSGEKVSEVLSEVDLSNPEDVKALIPANSSEILVHFGDDHFLERYRRFEEHLPAWHAQYPNLASVDMRYEREVVLDMAGASAAKADAGPAAVKTPTPAAPVKPVVAPNAASPRTAVKAPVKKKSLPLAKPVPHRPVAAPPKPHEAHAAAAKPSVAAPQATEARSASAAARSSYPTKPAAGKPMPSTETYHPPQVPTR